MNNVHWQAIPNISYWWITCFYHCYQYYCCCML